MIRHKAQPVSLEEKVIDQLKTVFDPEIPVNIYDLGLIYEVKVKEARAFILMTFTSPNCPVAEILPEEVRQKVSNIDGIDETDIEITFEPPWDQEMLSDEAKLELGLL